MCKIRRGMQVCAAQRRPYEADEVALGTHSIEFEGNRWNSQVIQGKSNGTQWKLMESKNNTTECDD